MPIISPTAISPHRIGKAGINWSSYWATREPSELVLTPLSETSIKVDWTDGDEAADGMLIYVDDVLEDTVAYGDETYTITGLTQNTGYTIKVLAYKGVNLSTGVTDTAWTAQLFTLTAAGTGGDVAYFVMQTSVDVVCTIDGTGHFYTDSGGTANESVTTTITAGADRTKYLRLPSGSAKLLIFHENTITRWTSWTSPTNAPTITTDITRMSNLTYFYIAGKNTITGSVTLLTKLTYIGIFSSNTITGSINGLTLLEHLEATGSNSIAGDVANLTSITYIRLAGSGAFYGDVTLLTGLTYLDVTTQGVISGDVTNLISLTTLKLTQTSLYGTTVTGSIEGMSDLTYLALIGKNTIYGSISGLTKLQYCKVEGLGTITAPNVTNLTGLCYLYFNIYTVLSSANINQILADFWTNKDAAKSRSERVIDIRGSYWSGPPTGQGIIDKAALESYSSPTPPGTASTWTITTREASAEQFDNGKVVFAYDGNHPSGYTDIYPALLSQGILGTFYLVSGSIGETNNLTWAQVLTMYANSMDIQCHTYDHVDLRTLNQTETTSNLQAVNDDFTAHSIDVPIHLAYPYGYYNATVKTQVSGLRTTGRTVGGFSGSYPIYKDCDKYALPGYGIESLSATELAQLKTILDQVYENKGAVILFIHWINDGNPDNGGISTSDFNEIIDYVQASGSDIVTMSQLNTLIDA